MYLVFQWEPRLREYPSGFGVNYENKIFALGDPNETVELRAQEVRNYAASYPGTTTIYVVSTGADDIREPSSG